MTRIISILNFKGGTAKTTTVVNVGMGLALRGHRVLAIDLDPQGSLATYLGVPPGKTLADILLGRAEWRDCVQPARERFDIIPADRPLAEAKREIPERGWEPDILRRRLADLPAAGYDFILLDCAPSMDILSEAALCFSQEIFVPVSMDYLALVGARMVIIEVLRARRLLGPRIARISLVVPSFYAARVSRSLETMSILEQYFPGMVAEPIHISTRLAESPGHRLTIFEYDPHGVASADYARLVERIAADVKPCGETA